MEASKMYRLNKIQQMLGDRQVQAIADATGLSRWTIYNVRNGVGKIRYETIERLSDILKIILSAINNRTASLVMQTVRRGKQCRRTQWNL